MDRTWKDALEKRAKELTPAPAPAPSPRFAVGDKVRLNSRLLTPEGDIRPDFRWKIEDVQGYTDKTVVLRNGLGAVKVLKVTDYYPEFNGRMFRVNDCIVTSDIDAWFDWTEQQRQNQKPCPTTPHG
jgi:hypothetical protein